MRPVRRSATTYSWGTQISESRAGTGPECGEVRQPIGSVFLPSPRHVTDWQVHDDTVSGGRETQNVPVLVPNTPNTRMQRHSSCAVVATYPDLNLVSCAPDRRRGETGDSEGVPGAHEIRPRIFDGSNMPPALQRSRRNLIQDRTVPNTVELYILPRSRQFPYLASKRALIEPKFGGCRSPGLEQNVICWSRPSYVPDHAEIWSPKTIKCFRRSAPQRHNRCRPPAQSVKPGSDFLDCSISTAHPPPYRSSNPRVARGPSTYFPSGDTTARFEPAAELSGAMNRVTATICDTDIPREVACASTPKPPLIRSATLPICPKPAACFACAASPLQGGFQRQESSYGRVVVSIEANSRRNYCG